MGLRKGKGLWEGGGGLVDLKGWMRYARLWGGGVGCLDWRVEGWCGWLRGWWWKRGRVKELSCVVLDCSVFGCD